MMLNFKITSLFKYDFLLFKKLGDNFEIKE